MCVHARPLRKGAKFMRTHYTHAMAREMASLCSEAVSQMMLFRTTAWHSIQYVRTHVSHVCCSGRHRISSSERRIGRTV